MDNPVIIETVGSSQEDLDRYYYHLSPSLLRFYCVE